MLCLFFCNVYKFSWIAFSNVKEAKSIEVYLQPLFVILIVDLMKECIINELIICGSNTWMKGHCKGYTWEFKGLLKND